MRKLLLDAAEATWWLCTAPLRRLIRDAVREALTDERVDTPALKWNTEEEDVDRVAGWDVGLAGLLPELVFGVRRDR